MARLPRTRLTPGDKVAGITDGESVYQLAGDDGPTVLVAIDGTTVQKRWRLAGIHTNCRMALTGDDGPLAVDEKPSLVVLDRSTGNQVRRYPIGRSPFQDLRWASR